MSAKNRQELLDEIAAYHPFNEQEERDKNLIFQWIEQKNSRPIHRRYSDKSVSAILFYPVKALAADHSSSEEEKAQLLEELIEMIQRAILA